MIPLPYYKADFPEIWEVEQPNLEKGAHCGKIGMPMEQTKDKEEERIDETF